MNKSYDEQLRNLNDLKWLPWVGDHFQNAFNNKRILLVGESHYFNNEDDQDNHANQEYTRQIVWEMGVNSNTYGSPFFSNILRLFFLNTHLTSEQRLKFWNAVGFYNFVQRPMSTKKGRPSKSDFQTGWKNFYELVRVLKPTSCIFLGLSAADHYKTGIPHAGNFVLNEINWGEIKFGRSNSKYLQLQEDNLTTSIYSVQHPSSFFSPVRCNSFLKLKDPETLSHLRDVIGLSPE